MIAAVVGLSILAIVALMIGTLTGAAAGDGISQGIWPLVIMLPRFGLPIGFALLIALLIVTAVRRSREARAGSS